MKLRQHGARSLNRRGPSRSGTQEVQGKGPSHENWQRGWEATDPNRKVESEKLEKRGGSDRRPSHGRLEG